MMGEKAKGKAIVRYFGGVRDLMEGGKEVAGGGDASLSFMTRWNPLSARTLWPRFSGTSLKEKGRNEL